MKKWGDYVASQMITAAEVAEIMDCSERYGYSIIKQLNQELADKGYITRRGRVSRTYFLERTGILGKEEQPHEKAVLHTVPEAPQDIPPAQGTD